MRALSGDQATELMTSLCAAVLSTRGDVRSEAAFHTRSDPNAIVSNDAVARRVPSGEKAAEVTAL